MENEFVKNAEERLDFLKTSYEKLNDDCPEDLKNEPLINTKLRYLKKKILEFENLIKEYETEN